MDKRPASQIVIAVYFSIATAGLIVIGNSSMHAGTQGYIGQFGAALTFAAALVLLIAVRAKWVYVVLSLFLASFPAVLLILIAVILVKIKAATLVSVVPSIFVCGLLLWPSYAYAFGSASRTYYGIVRSLSK